MIRIFLLLLLSGLCISSKAQFYGYEFLPGWTSYFTAKTDSGYLNLSLGSDSSLRHYFIVNQINNDFSLKESKDILLPASNSRQTMYSSFAVDYNGNNLVWGGAEIDSTSKFHGSLYTWNAHDVVTKRTFELENNLVSRALLIDKEDTILTGVHVLSNGAFETLLIKNGGVKPHRYKCDFHLPRCRVNPLQIEKGNECYYILSQTSSNDPFDDRKSYLIKVDTSGKLIWEYAFDDTDYWLTEPIMAVLNNGNILVSYTNSEWKPKRMPPDYTNLETQSNKEPNVHVVELNAIDGRILKAENLGSKIFDAHGRWLLLEPKHIAKGSYGDLFITGVVNNVGDKKGYLMKITQNGEFKWLRLVTLDIGSAGAKEDLILNSVTNVGGKGLVLSGEYLCIDSEELKVTQSAVVIKTDSFGCQTPGCHLADNVVSPESKRELFSIYPNPNYGTFRIKGSSASSNHNRLSYQLISASGSIIKEGEIVDFLPFIEKPGVYFLKIFNQNRGLFQVIKIAVIH
jgi:hypothetical protein